MSKQNELAQLADAVTVDGSNVGIGTDSGVNLLNIHQSDASSNSYLHITHADGGAGGSNGLSIGLEGDGVNAVIRNRENGYLRMYTNNTERMRIDASGNVGIGTSSPSSWAKLDILGTGGLQNGATQALQVRSPSTTAGEGVGIRLNAASGSHEAVGIIGMVNNASGNAGSMTFHTYNGGATIPERMRIDASGRVTKPYQPAFCTTGNTASFSGETFKGTVLLNNGNYYSTSSGKFTAPVAGIYAFSFNLTTEDTNSHFTYISVNGGNANGYQLSYGVTYQSATQNIVVSLSAGDYVEGKRRATGYSVYRANFSGHLIG